MKIKYIGIIIFLVFNTVTMISARNTNGDQDHYRVEIDPLNISMNKTLSMSRGDVKEYNVSFTPENKSFTVIIEILPGTGRLWGLFIENQTTYYKAKDADSFTCCQKVADHVSGYQVMHMNMTLSEDSDYVLAFHNSHLHEEPETTFNFLLLRGFQGIETLIQAVSDSAHDHGDSESVKTSVLFFALGLIILMIISIKTRNKNI